MTSLLPRFAHGSAADPADTAGPPAPGGPADDLRRRPLVLVALVGGVVAAASTLAVCLVLGLVGWALADGGTHGSPGTAVRTGALGWLLAHGSGLQVDGVAVTAVPLGVTALAAWVTWRLGLRVGAELAGHGPDVEQISDGARDWTVLVASFFFLTGYLAVTVATWSLAATPATAPDGRHALRWALVLCLALAVPGIAIGAGRAAIWAAWLPTSVRAAWAAGVRVTVTFGLVAAAVFAVALARDADTAANVLAQLGTDSADTAVYLALSGTVLPNAVVFTGSYLLGPGFAVGAQTVVSPTAVVVGPLPMFPLLAALPDSGATPGWVLGLMLLGPLAGLLGAAWAQARFPTARWEQGALRGCAGGVVAGLLTAGLALLSAGAVGPGRMQVVGPDASEVLTHAVTAFGIGGLLGGLAMTAWQRRVARRLLGHPAH